MPESFHIFVQKHLMAVSACSVLRATGQYFRNILKNCRNFRIRSQPAIQRQNLQVVTTSADKTRNI